MIEGQDVKYRINIYQKLIFYIFGIGLLGIAAGLSIIYFIGRDSIKQSIGDSFMKLASLTSDKLELLIEHHIEESFSFGSSVNLLTIVERSNELYQDENETDIIGDIRAIEERWSDIDEGDRILSEILNNNASLYMRNYERQHDNINIIDRGVHYNIIATDIMGKVTAALNKPSHYYYGDKVWWKSAYNNGNGRVYLSDIEYDDDLKAYTFGIAAPIMDGNKVIGVLYMIHNVDIFFRWVTSIKVGETDHTMLASSDGVLLFCPIFPIRSHSLHPELREEIFKDKPGWGVTVNDVHYKGEAINGYAPVGITVSFGLNNFGGKRWYIFTSQNPEETYSPINRLLKWIVISGFMVLGIVSVLGSIVAKRIISPIKELKRGAELIGDGNLDYSIYVDTGDEIEDLASEFNEMAKKLKKSYTGLEQLSRIKSEFVSKVSHELRTPLTSIKGFVEILLSYDGIEEGVRKDFLTIINEESTRLSRLINDLLDLSKIEAGKVEWQIRPINLTEIIEFSIKSMRALAIDKNLSISTRIADNIPLIMGDKDKLLQVLENLINNAIKFTHKGKIIVGADIYGKNVRIFVSDTGIGIPEKDMEKIFERFHQLGDTEKGKPKGTGLGLAISREIAAYLGGSIYCESKVGKGSTFYLIIPAAPLFTKWTKEDNLHEDKVLAIQSSIRKGG
ncbi:MAG: ATP-binding protein [Nitrospirota bacterium]